MKASKEKQLHTLENAILAMREKIEEQIPNFKEQLVKDYGNALKAYHELSEIMGAETEEANSLDSIRAMFKVAK